LLNNNERYPRPLTDAERNWIFTALPENKPGYKKYRDIIDSYSVIGAGRFGAGNLILGNDDDVADPDNLAAPIFAIANITYGDAGVYVALHEEVEEQIEIDFKASSSGNIPDDLSLAKVWTYSTWVPGQKAPNDNAEVRQIYIIPGQVILAVAPTHKKIWVYNSKSGINHFIPVTNFYNQVMLIQGITDPETALNPGRLFTDLNEFSDELLAGVFLVYNKHWKRINLDYNLFEKKGGDGKKSFFGLFNKQR
jgi:hypothetical protein